MKIFVNWKVQICSSVIKWWELIMIAQYYCLQVGYDLYTKKVWIVSKCICERRQWGIFRVFCCFCANQRNFKDWWILIVQDSVATPRWSPIVFSNRTFNVIFNFWIFCFWFGSSKDNLSRCHWRKWSFLFVCVYRSTHKSFNVFIYNHMFHYMFWS